MKKRQLKKELRKLQALACYGLESVKIGDKIYSDTEEYLILSEPYVKHYDSICVDAEVIRCGKKSSFSNELFLQDRNIVNGGYNLYRGFKDKKTNDKYHSLVKKISKIVKERNGKHTTVYKIKPNIVVTFNANKLEKR